MSTRYIVEIDGTRRVWCYTLSGARDAALLARKQYGQYVTVKIYELREVV